jgi:hypothetical protein
MKIWDIECKGIKAMSMKLSIEATGHIVCNVNSNLHSNKKKGKETATGNGMMFDYTCDVLKSRTVTEED